MIPLVSHQITVRETDAFRTKAISLLKERNIFPTVKHILQTVKASPIHATENGSQITLEQKLSETVLVKGVFERCPGGSRPLSNTFSIVDLEKINLTHEL